MDNRKKWRWIFSIFAVVVIVSLAIALVFLNKKDDDNTNNDEDETSQTTHKYATSFSLNIPDTIQILIGTKVNLKTGYVNVKPSSMLEKLTLEVTPKASGVVNGIKFANNTIIASSIGNYTIKFKMPKSSSTYFIKTINILVYEEKTSSHIYQTNNSMIIAESININEMFYVSDGKAFEVATDERANYSNNKITAQSVGESELTFRFAENYIEYVYVFTITIKDVPVYKIVLINVLDNTISIDLSENDVKFINFQVKNREEENVAQAVTVSSSNEDIVIIESLTDDVLIKIRALSMGDAKITISLVSDSTVKMEINVIVI